MGLHLVDAGTLTVKQGSPASQAYATQSALGATSTGGIDIYTPAYQSETFVLQAAPIRNPQTADWLIMQWQPGSDVFLPALRAVSVPFAGGMRAIRVFCTNGNALADRVFKIVIQVASDSEL